MDKEKIDLLLKRYLDGGCTEEERQLLELWFARQSTEGNWEWADESEKELMASRIYGRLNEVIDKPIVQLKYKRFVRTASIAASFLILMGVGLGLYHGSRLSSSDKLSSQTFVDSLSASEEVSLLLADGSLLSMDDIDSDSPYGLGQRTVKKIARDELILGNEKKYISSKAPGLAGLIVPKGKTFKLTMDDGTKVWVNTASTVSFPSGETESKRQVVLEDGEAYFEVAKDKDRPFVVKAGGTDILVLGTRFNVSAYKEEEKVVTTLAEGSVKLSNGKGTTMLKPSQQAVSYKQSHAIVTSEVDVDNVLAWQKGYFVFDNQDITSIMHDISRWYDVEVSYQGAVSKKKFGGTFSKSKSVAELLSYLESISGNLRFKQIGRRIIVMS